MIQYQSTSEFSEIVLSCRCAFSKRSWPYLTAMAIPWLIASGQRHIRRLCTGVSWKRHESGFYRFLSRFKFRRELFFQILLELIVRTFQPAELLVVADDTLCPKWGKHIFGAASFFDHVRRPRPGFIWGHNWVVLAVVVRLFGVPVALPFWIELYRTQSTCPKELFRTRLDMVAQALSQVRVWAQQNLAEEVQPPTSFAGQLCQLRGDLMTETILRSIPGRKLSKRNSEALARLAVA